VPYLRACEYIRKFFQPRVKPECFAKLKRKVDSLKQPNPKNSASMQVDLDSLMDIAQVEFRSLIIQVEPSIKNLFQVCDVFFHYN